MRYALFIIAALFFSCQDDDNPITPSTSPNQILPIGDSRIDGNRPIFESYRYELWKLLVDSGQEFDIVGPYNDNDHEGSYELYQGLEFDDDHAGVGGFESEDVLETMNAILSASPEPDIVLLGIGGNDLIAEDEVDDVIENISQIIDRLQAANSEVVIVLEQIAPGFSLFMSPELTEAFNNFNEQIAIIGQQQSTGSSPIIVVNMTENWSDNYLADLVHYNEEGARFIAQRYFDAFVQYLAN